MPEVGEFFYTKHALHPIYDHTVVKEQMEDLTKLSFVLMLSPAGNKDVIEIGKDEGYRPSTSAMPWRHSLTRMGCEGTPTDQRE